MGQERFSIIASSAGPDSIEITLTGQLVVRNAVSIQKELVAAAAGSNNITLALRNLTKIDLAAMQLLVALQKSAAKSGKSLAFDFELTGYVRAALEHSGFSEIFTGNFQNV